MSDRHDLFGWGTHNPCHDCPSIKCGNPDCDWMIVLPPTDAVPRVARSLDDLRVGQVVAWYADDEVDPAIYRITANWRDQFRAEAVGSHYADDFEPSAAFRASEPKCWDGRIVILADPPEPDFLVPRAVMERLRETWLKVAQHPAHVEPDDVVGIQNGWLFDRVGDLIDAATEVEAR